MSNFYVEKIELTNFKIFKKACFSFKPHKNIIVGANAVGKTTLMEAIYCLFFTKTFKNLKDFELINYNETFFNIKGEIIEKSEEKSKLFLGFDSTNKIIKKGNKIYTKSSDFIGEYRAVVFSPDDLELIKGSPSIRRHFLDINISQIKHKYLLDVIKYKKLLKERNELLKQNNNDQRIMLLEILTQKMEDIVTSIVQERKQFISSLNEKINKYIFSLSRGQENIELVYNPNVNVDNLLKSRQERMKNDLYAKHTTWGPLRDDVSTLLNGKNASSFASQGQIRSIVISLKMALTDVFTQETENIVIILDDVLSEFDESRQNELFKMLNGDKQVFMTTTSIAPIAEDILNSSNIIEIKGGREYECE